MSRTDRAAGSSSSRFRSVIESRFGADGLRDLDTFIERAAIELVAVDLEQANVARRAFSRFGKGRHPAGLNYGDCFAYAWRPSAPSRSCYKGEDFSQTDVARVTVPPEPGR